MLKRLDRGDVLIVTRLDRLARSTRDLLNILDESPRPAPASVADRRLGRHHQAHGRLMLTVLAGLAEFERELILARTGEGRKRAQATWGAFWRPPALTSHQRQEALARREAGETLMDIARSYGVSHPTISRL